MVDATLENRSTNYLGDFVQCSRGHTKVFSEAPAELKSVKFSTAGEAREAHGEWIGLIKTNKVGSEVFYKAILEISTRSDFNKLKIPDLLSLLLDKKVKVNVMYINGHWMDVDTYADVSKGQSF